FDQVEEKFFSVSRRNQLLEQIGLSIAPAVGQGKFTRQQLVQLLGSLHSRLGADKAEGIYLRQDNDLWLERRAKIVRAEFVAEIEEHWKSKPLVPNTLTGILFH